MQTQIISVDNPEYLSRSLDVLNKGGLVAFPTDTVYGLGAMAFNPEAIDQLYIAKGRDIGKAIAILVGDTGALDQVSSGMNEISRRLAQRFWPGPLTLVVPIHQGLPTNLSPLPTIGLRMPDHPIAIALLRLSGPLAVTSANLSGKPSTTTAQEVLDQLAGHIPLILDGGRTSGGVPSTVVDCTGMQPIILRIGPISQDNIKEALV
jgi:L-threonylcarbamoyladenylate synthase